ncbi:DUF4352 domain-containing protein [Leucobacter sp. NPDC015123]|uniref:DUF4352 domain-containing protein n=1 Tax=Leucobacter sp. NPDC015123 TaxID=3364129 RepID=UPI0036F465ED
MDKKLIATGLVGLLLLSGCSSSPSVEQPSSSEQEQTAPEAQEAAKEGTRDNPFPIGSAVTDGDWTVTVNSVTLDGTQAIADENPFNEAPAEGSQHMLVNVTATYNGDDADGAIPMLTLEYVTKDGNTINSFDKMIVPPEQFNSIETLYAGASTTGNFAFEIPTATAGEGTLALKADMLGDKVFVAVQ